MPLPDPDKRHYMFTNDIKFVQKIVILTPENKFLTIKRGPDQTRPGHWDLPGGNVLFGEPHDDSLLKEIKEETGLDIKTFTPISISSAFENGIYYLLIGYKTLHPEVPITLSNEHTEYRWVTKEEFLQLKSDSFKVAIVNALSP